MKQTEIGMIPDDWEVKEIKDFADVTTGDKNTQDAEENGKYPFFVRSSIVEKINKFSYDVEGVITAGDGVGTGKVFHYAKGKFGLHQRAYLIYNFKNTDPKYFYYNFSKNFYERVHSMTAKSSVDSVRREMITKMQIPIPPTLPEQQRIAKALSDVDALITTTEKLIQKKKNIKQGTMQELLTGKKRLTGFAKSTNYKQSELGPIPEDWEVKSLGDIAFVTKLAGFEFTAHVNYSEIGKIIALRGLNVKKGYLVLDDVKFIDNSNFSKLDRSKLYINDLLFTYVGTVGNVALVNKNDTYYLAPNVALIRGNKYVYSYFLMYLMLSQHFFDNQIQALMSTTSQAALSMTNIRLFKIPLPSIEEQTAIANVLFCMDKEIETLNTKLEKYRNIKTAMMQQLLTGKIRLG